MTKNTNCTLTIKAKVIPNYIQDLLTEPNEVSERQKVNGKWTNTHIIRIKDRARLLKILALVAAHNRADKQLFFVTNNDITGVVKTSKVLKQEKAAKIAAYQSEFEQALSNNQNIDVIVNAEDKSFLDKVKNVIESFKTGNTIAKYAAKNHLLKALLILQNIKINSDQYKDSQSIATEIRGLLSSYCYEPAFVAKMVYGENGEASQAYFQITEETLAKGLPATQGLQINEYKLAEDRSDFDKEVNDMIIGLILREKGEVGVTIKYVKDGKTYYKLFKGKYVQTINGEQVIYEEVKNDTGLESLKNGGLYNEFSLYIPDYKFKTYNNWDYSTQVLTGNEGDSINRPTMRKNEDFLKNSDVNNTELFFEDSKSDVTTQLLLAANQAAEVISNGAGDFNVFKNHKVDLFSSIVFTQKRIEKLSEPFDTIVFKDEKFQTVKSEPLDQILTKGFSERSNLVIKENMQGGIKIGSVNPLNYFFIKKSGGYYTTESVDLSDPSFAENDYEKLKQFIDDNFSLDGTILNEGNAKLPESFILGNSRKGLKFTNIKISELKKAFILMQKQDSDYVELLKEKINAVYQSFINNIEIYKDADVLIKEIKENKQSKVTDDDEITDSNKNKLTPDKLGLTFSIKSNANFDNKDGQPIYYDLKDIYDSDKFTFSYALKEGESPKNYRIYKVYLRKFKEGKTTLVLHYLFQEGTNIFIEEVNNPSQEFKKFVDLVESKQVGYVGNSHQNPKLIIIEPNGYAEAELKNTLIPGNNFEIASDEIVDAGLVIADYTKKIDILNEFFKTKLELNKNTKGTSLLTALKDQMPDELSAGFILAGNTLKLKELNKKQSKNELSDKLKLENKKIGAAQINVFKYLLLNYNFDSVLRMKTLIEGNMYLRDVLLEPDNIYEYFQSQNKKIFTLAFKFDYTNDNALTSSYYLPLSPTVNKSNENSVQIYGFAQEKTKNDQVPDEFKTIALNFLLGTFVNTNLLEDSDEGRLLLKNALIKGWTDYVIYKYNSSTDEDVSTFGETTNPGKNNLNKLLARLANGGQLENNEETNREIGLYYLTHNSDFVNNITTKAKLSIYNNITPYDFKSGEFKNKLKLNLNQDKPINKIIKFKRDQSVPPDSQESQNKKNQNENDSSNEIIKNASNVTTQGETGEQIENIPYKEDEFKFSDEGVFVNDRVINDKDRNEILKRIYPEITVEMQNAIPDLNDLMDRVNKASVPIGMATGNLIKLTKDSAGLLYHESFHVVFNQLFNKEERSNLLEEIKKRLIYSKQDVLDIANKRGITDYKKAEEKFLEEKLADNFANYRLEKDKEIKGDPNSFKELFRGIGNWIKGFFDKLLSWIGLSKIDKVKQEFDKIDNGFYSKRKSNQSTVTNYSYEDIKIRKIINNVNTPISATSSQINEMITYLFFYLGYKKVGLGNTKEKSLDILTKFMYTQFKLERNDITAYKNLQDLVINNPKDSDELFDKSNELRNIIEKYIYPSIEKSNRLLSNQAIKDLNQELEQIEDINGEKSSAEEYGKEGFISQRQLDPSKIGSDLNIMLSTIGVVNKNNSTDVPDFIYYDVKTFIKKVQKVFSTIPIDKLNIFGSFWTNLKELSKYDTELNIFKDYLAFAFKLNGTKEEIQNTDYGLLNKLVNRLCLNPVFYKQGLVEKKKYGMDTLGKFSFDEFILTDAFLNSNKTEIKQMLIHKKEAMITASIVYGILNGETEGQASFYYQDGKNVYKLNANQNLFNLYYTQKDPARFKTSLPSDSNILDIIKNYPIDRSLFISTKVNSVDIDNILKKENKSNLDEFTKVAAVSYLHTLNGINVHLPYCFMFLHSHLKNKINYLMDVLNDKGSVMFNIDNLSNDLIYNAIRFGTYIRATVIKDSNGNNVFALTKDAPTDKLNVRKDNTDNMLPNPRVFMALSHKHFKNQSYSNLNPAQRLQFQIASFREGMVSLGQIGANEVSFFVKTDMKQYMSDEIKTKNEIGLETYDKFFDDFNSMYTFRINKIIQNYETLLSYYKDGYITEEGKKELMSGTDTLTNKEENFIVYDANASEKKYTLNINGKGFNLFYQHFILINNNGNVISLDEFITKINKLSDNKIIGSNDQDIANKIKELKSINLNNNFIKEQLKTLIESEVAVIQKTLNDDIQDNEASAGRKKSAQYLNEKYISVLSNFCMNSIISTDDVYKELFGANYAESFKNSNTDVVVRLQALAAFGEPVREFTKVQIKDVNLYTVEGEGKYLVISEDHFNKTYGKNGKLSKEFLDLGYKSSKVVATDGQAINTFIHKFFLIVDKCRQFRYTKAYYSYMMSNMTMIEVKKNNTSTFEKVIEFDADARLAYENNFIEVNDKIAANKEKLKNVINTDKEQEEIRSEMISLSKIIEQRILSKDKREKKLNINQKNSTQEDLDRLSPQEQNSIKADHIEIDQDQMKVARLRRELLSLSEEEFKLKEEKKQLKTERSNIIIKLSNTSYGKYLDQQSYIEDVIDDAKDNQYMNGIGKTAVRGVIDDLFFYSKMAENTEERSQYMKVVKKEAFQDLFYKVVDGKQFGILHMLNVIDQNYMLLKTSLAEDKKTEIKNEIEKCKQTLKILYNELYNQDPKYSIIIKPVKGQEYLFNLMMVAEKKGVDMMVYGSGEKVSQTSKIMKIPAGYKVNQSEMNNHKDEIAKATQREKGLLMNIDPTVDIAYDGEVMKMDKVVDIYIQKLTEMVEYNNNMVKTIAFENEGPGAGENWDMTIMPKLFKIFVETTRNSLYNTDFYNTKVENGVTVFKSPIDLSPVCNVHFQTLVKLYNMAARFKLNGEAYQAISSIFYSARYDSKNRLVPYDMNDDDVIVDPANREKSIRPLAILLEVLNKTTGKFEETNKSLKELKGEVYRDVHQAVVSATEEWQKEWLKDVKAGFTHEELNEKYDPSLFYMLSVRIPIEGPRSIGITKIVDFLPSETGSKIKHAASLQDQSGADNDGDKYYTQRLNATKVDGKWTVLSRLNETNTDQLHEDFLLKKSIFKGALKELKEEENGEKILNEKVSKYLKSVAGTASNPVLQNDIFNTSISLFSNNHVIDTGLQREKTDIALDAVNEATKTHSVTNRKKITGNITGSVTSKNRKEDVARGNTIDIAASSYIKGGLLTDIGQQTESLNNISAGSNKFSFNIVANITNPEIKTIIKSIDESFCDLRNKKMTKDYGEEVKNKEISLIKPDEVDLLSKRTGILVSIAIDAPKKSYPEGINLNQYTLQFLISGSLINVPKNILLHIAAHPLIRELCLLGELKKTIKDYASALEEIIKREGQPGVHVNEKDGIIRIMPTSLKMEDIFKYEKDQTNILDLNAKPFDTVYSEYCMIKLMMNLVQFGEDTNKFSPMTNINKGSMDIGEMYNLVALLSSPLISLSDYDAEKNDLYKAYLSDVSVGTKEKPKLTWEQRKTILKQKYAKAGKTNYEKTNHISLGQHLGIDINDLPIPLSRLGLQYNDLSRYKIFKVYAGSIINMLKMIKGSSLVSTEITTLFDELNPNYFNDELINIASIIRYGMILRNNTSLKQVNSFIEKLTVTADNQIVSLVNNEPMLSFSDTRIAEILQATVLYLKIANPDNSFIQKLTFIGPNLIIPNYSFSNDDKGYILLDIDILLKSDEAKQPIIDLNGNTLNISTKELMEGLLNRDIYLNATRWSNKSLTPFINADFYQALQTQTKEWDNFMSKQMLIVKREIASLTLSLQDSLIESEFKKDIKIHSIAQNSISFEVSLTKIGKGDEETKTVVDSFVSTDPATYLNYKGVKYKNFKVGKVCLAVALNTDISSYDNLSILERKHIENDDFEEVEDPITNEINYIFKSDQNLLQSIRMSGENLIVITPLSVIEFRAFSPDKLTTLNVNTSYKAKKGFNEAFSTYGKQIRYKIDLGRSDNSYGVASPLSKQIFSKVNTDIMTKFNTSIEVVIFKKTWTNDNHIIDLETDPEEFSVHRVTELVNNEIIDLFSAHLLRNDLDFQKSADKFHGVLPGLVEKETLVKTIINLVSNKFGTNAVDKFLESPKITAEETKDIEKISKKDTKKKEVRLKVNKVTEVTEITNDTEKKAVDESTSKCAPDLAKKAIKKIKI